MPKGKRRKFETKSDVLPPVKVDQRPEPPKPEPWKPEPDMGTIAPPPPAEKVGVCCKHQKETHYGGPKGWCNVGGCSCQEFK